MSVPINTLQTVYFIPEINTGTLKKKKKIKAICVAHFLDVIGVINEKKNPLKTVRVCRV